MGANAPPRALTKNEPTAGLASTMYDGRLQRQLGRTLAAATHKWVIDVLLSSLMASARWPALSSGTERSLRGQSTTV